MLIKKYTIHYIDEAGLTAKTDIIASNLNEAINQLGVAKHNFISKEITYKLSKDIKITTQLQILTRIAGGVQSGESVSKYLQSIVADFRELKSKKNLIKSNLKKGHTLSQLLNALEINPICIKIIENSERSGKTAASIKDAKQFLRLEEKIQKNTLQTLKGQSLMILISLLLIFVVPFYVVDFFEQMKNSGIRLSVNFSTDILYFLAEYGLYFFTILMTIACVALIWQTKFLILFGKIYPVSLFRAIANSKKSILFLSIFTPLYKAKISTESILESYASINFIAANKLKKLTTQGVAIADGVQKLSFSNTFKAGFKGFNRISDDSAKLNMLSELFDALSDDLNNYAKQASTLIKSTTNILNYSILIILVHGFMVPQLSMGVIR